MCIGFKDNHKKNNKECISNKLIGGGIKKFKLNPKKARKERKRNIQTWEK